MSLEKMNKVYGMLFMFLAWVATLLLARLQTMIEDRERRKDRRWIRLIRIFLYSLVASAVYTGPMFSFSCPPFPSFLQFHFDEIPLLVVGLEEGPMAALIVLLIKSGSRLLFQPGDFLGVFADFVISATFVLPACFLHEEKQGWKPIALGLFISVPLSCVVSILVNVFIVIPAYVRYFGFSEEEILSICQQSDPGIENLTWSYAFRSVLPFNLLKELVVVAFALLFYQAGKWATKEEPRRPDFIG